MSDKLLVSAVKGSACYDSASLSIDVLKLLIRHGDLDLLMQADNITIVERRWMFSPKNYTGFWGNEERRAHVQNNHF